MDKENFVHLHKGLLLSVKKDDTLKFTHKYMKVEKTILSEVTQMYKDKHGIYLYVDIRSKENETRL